MPGRNNPLPPVIHEILRDAVVEHYSTPAISSTKVKGTSDRPGKHWWSAEPVAESLLIAEAVSTHPERVFAPLRSENDATAEGVNMLASFVTVVNAGRRWTGLDEIPRAHLRPHMFRRTMAMLTQGAAALRAAMTRLLEGHPQRTDGRLTKENLYKEAQVSRATMNRAHAVTAEWDAHLAVNGKTTPGEAQRDARLEAKTQECTLLSNKLKAAATAITALHHDNEALPQQLARDTAATVSPIRPRQGSGRLR